MLVMFIALISSGDVSGGDSDDGDGVTCDHR